MGNACGCGEDKPDGPNPTNISNISPYTPYKVPNFQSRINSQHFAVIPSEDKDAVLVEAFKHLISSVPSSKVTTDSQLIKQLTARTSGKATNTNGDQYEGEFVNGVASGKGKIQRKDKTTYEGEVMNGVPHGTGVVQTASGQRIKTTFISGSPVGHYLETTTTPTKSTLEGGSNERGLRVGPQLSVDDKGTTTFKLFKDGKEEGIQVSIPKDRSIITVTERKGEQTTKIGTYTSRVTGQPTAAK